MSFEHRFGIPDPIELLRICLWEMARIFLIYQFSILAREIRTIPLLGDLKRGFIARFYLEYSQIAIRVKIFDTYMLYFFAPFVHPSSFQIVVCL